MKQETSHGNSVPLPHSVQADWPSGLHSSLVSAKDRLTAKPNSESYKKAASLIEISVRYTVVVEDSWTGAQAHTTDIVCGNFESPTVIHAATLVGG
jgi:hypothetical protein